MIDEEGEKNKTNKQRKAEGRRKGKRKERKGKGKGKERERNPGGQNSLVGSEAMDGSIFHAESNHSNTLALVHQQIQSKVFHEKVGVVSQCLAIKGVKDGMSCSVCCCCTPSCLSSFWFWVLGVGVLGVGCWVLGVGCWV